MAPVLPRTKLWDLQVAFWSLTDNLCHNPLLRLVKPSVLLNVGDCSYENTVERPRARVLKKPPPSRERRGVSPEPTQLGREAEGRRLKSSFPNPEKYIPTCAYDTDLVVFLANESKLMTHSTTSRVIRARRHCPCVNVEAKLTPCT